VIIQYSDIGCENPLKWKTNLSYDFWYFKLISRLIFFCNSLFK
jgi:hypothetical protein